MDQKPSRKKKNAEDLLSAPQNYPLGQISPHSPNYTIRQPVSRTMQQQPFSQRSAAQMSRPPFAPRPQSGQRPVSSPRGPHPNQQGQQQNAGGQRFKIEVPQNQQNLQHQKQVQHQQQQVQGQQKGPPTPRQNNPGQSGASGGRPQQHGPGQERLIPQPSTSLMKQQQQKGDTNQRPQSVTDRQKMPQGQQQGAQGQHGSSEHLTRGQQHRGRRGSRGRGRARPPIVLGRHTGIVHGTEGSPSLTQNSTRGGKQPYRQFRVRGRGQTVQRTYLHNVAPSDESCVPQLLSLSEPSVSTTNRRGRGYGRGRFRGSQRGRYVNRVPYIGFTQVPQTGRQMSMPTDTESVVSEVSETDGSEWVDDEEELMTEGPVSDPMAEFGAAIVKSAFDFGVSVYHHGFEESFRALAAKQFPPKPTHKRHMGFVVRHGMYNKHVGHRRPHKTTGCGPTEASEDEDTSGSSSQTETTDDDLEGAVQPDDDFEVIDEIKSEVSQDAAVSAAKKKKKRPRKKKPKAKDGVGSISGDMAVEDVKQSVPSLGIGQVGGEGSGQEVEATKKKKVPTATLR